MGEQTWRDASGRLTCNSHGVEVVGYPAMCRVLMDAFGLGPIGELVVGPEAIFQDYGRGDQVIGLEWDIWMGFTVVAKSPASEPLIIEIAAWLRSYQGGMVR